MMNFSKRHIANTSTKRAGIALFDKVTRLQDGRLKNRGSIPDKSKIIFSFLQSVPTGFKYSVQGVQVDLSPTIRGPQRERDCLPASTVEVKNEGFCASNSSYAP